MKEVASCVRPAGHSGHRGRKSVVLTTVFRGSVVRARAPEEGERTNVNGADAITFDDRTVLRIGTWRVDPTTDEISRGTETHKLEPRTMRLLLYLAAHPGQVVDVHRLLDEVWSGVVVTPGSVYQAIAQLRRLLGDQAEHPTYIDTHSRKGYRLVASVSPWVVPARDDQPPNGADSASPPLSSFPAVTAGRSWRRLLAAAFVGAVLVAVAFAWLFTSARRTAPIGPGVTTFNPPPHSIAVLPFVNMSGDKEQDYFSDGLTEELINSLARISELQVSARTSSFSFKGKDADLGTIARRLNVSSVLEGSVRRSGNTIRITAQLNNAVTGFHLWSQTYDHDLSNVLQLQTEIANAVASALKVTLLGEVGARLEVGGTRNPAAYEAYLRAESAYWHQNSGSDVEKAIAQYSEAVHLDSNFGRAYAGWSIALSNYATYYAQGAAAKRDWIQRARVPALNAVALAPDLAEGHLALAFVHYNSLDFRRTNEEFERAVALAPGNARILRNYGHFAVVMGHTDAGIASARRAALLDPLNVDSHGFLGGVLIIARRYEEAMVAYQHAMSLDPDSASLPLYTGAPIYYAIGNFDEMRSVCERFKEHFERVAQNCLALAYHKLGRHADAEAALAREKALDGDAGAVDYGRTYAQWGDIPKALDWLETAWRLRDPNLGYLKTDPLMDPLRKEPRFRAIERELKFPD